MNHVFTYGSLMFDPVWSRVVQGDYRQSNGSIHGFARKNVRDAAYPAVYPVPEPVAVEGVVYFEVDTGDLARLDRFEGDYYRREEHPVLLPDGAELGAWVYVFKEAYRHLVVDTNWDPDWFATEGVRLFMGHYKGFEDIGV